MHLTKPAGCMFQLLGPFIALIGLACLKMGGAAVMIGIILAPLGIWMFIRGRRTPENRVQKVNIQAAPADIESYKKISELENRIREMEKEEPYNPQEQNTQIKLPDRDENGRFIIPE